jgi:UDP:flavonoid glycosyltransferase YjiC (YdhE family)
LLAGKPQLFLPAHLEMMVHSIAAIKLGTGLMALERKPLGMQHKLKRLLEEPAFTQAARSFAERYEDLDVEKIPERFARQVEGILAK